MSKTALIFGASGVSGWAFVNEMLHDYPEKGVWAQVHALTNRPLTQEASLWPADPRLNIVSGIDLLAGTQDDLEKTIRSKVIDVEKVTHVYYLAYKANKDQQQELSDAAAMFRRSTTALDHLSPALEFVVLQTGAKMYGCHLLADHPTTYIHVPLSESQPRLRGPAGADLFYHAQLDWIAAYTAARSRTPTWSWCETRPDIIVGFVPNQNFYSLGTVLAIYLALYREVEGAAAACPFPGSTRSWTAQSNDSSADMIARQTIYLSLVHDDDDDDDDDAAAVPARRTGQAYNVADAKAPQTWRSKWPQLCAYFGLEGTPPTPTVNAAGETNYVRRYIHAHLATWKRMEREHGLRSGIADSDLAFEGFEYFLLVQFDFDRHYDMSKMYATGFTEERSVMQAWGGMFDRMRRANILPA